MEFGGNCATLMIQVVLEKSVLRPPFAPSGGAVKTLKQRFPRLCHQLADLALVEKFHHDARGAISTRLGRENRAKFYMRIPFFL